MNNPEVFCEHAWVNSINSVMHPKHTCMLTRGHAGLIHECICGAAVMI